MFLKRKMCLLQVVFLSIVCSMVISTTPTHAAGTNSDINIALGKTATASVSNYPETPPKALNGTYSNISDKWCTGYTNSEKWLKVDLGRSYSINRWVVYHAGLVESYYPEYNTRDFRLQKSNDGINWTTVDTVTNNKNPYTERNVATFIARYVRLYVDCGEQNSNSCARIYDFQLYYDKEVNYALNKKVSASEELGSEPAVNAVNGTTYNLSDKWCTGWSSKPKWLTVDLGRVYTLNRWRVVHAGILEDKKYNTKNFRIEASEDNVNWFSVDSVTNNTASITDRTVPYLFSGRYIRLCIDQSSQLDDSCARIYEFQLYNTYYSSQPTNLAYGKTATASSYNSGSVSEWPSEALDGSYEPYRADNTWTTPYGYGNNSWLTVDLGSPCTINKWVVISGNLLRSDTRYINKAFKLQASNDNVNWVDIDNVDNNYRNVCSRKTDSFTARYVRLYIQKSCDDNATRVAEFELYNQ